VLTYRLLETKVELMAAGRPAEEDYWYRPESIA